MNAEDFAVFFVADNFDEAAMIAENGGFAVAHKGKTCRFLLRSPHPWPVFP